MVAAGDPRERLDKLVVALLARAGTRVSRAAVQRWIGLGAVRVAGRQAKPAESVDLGVELTVEPLAPEPSAATPDASVPFEVIYEDEHLVVVDKPPGVVVHPARGHAGGTLVNGLLGRGLIGPAAAGERALAHADLAEAGATPAGEAYARPGIVHRLDKGTSGILVVAKDEPTREALKQSFAAHAIERAYVAIVVGRARDATYDTLHGRHPIDRLRFTSRVTRGKRAITHVAVLEHFDRSGASYVACRLETGRTHQIRVHLSERANTPILGDPCYGRAPASPFLRELAADLGHQALHAERLGFVHPASGQALHFERPPPPDFARALERLRQAELAAQPTRGRRPRAR